ncbi:calcium-binding protein [Knoellia sp. 3-2P3]|uniref:calcium-binding protein n=1 Tax=unclassified Knoellia TaxID=2618719 RepID=UPI0023D99AE7|nr:calcium-binding protein [Knoellia sp. 3-2P3]MDF2093111.1 calcium-binding protein [Knoellia sp. 3-2P3]
MKRTFSRVTGTTVLAAAILASGQAAYAATWTGTDADNTKEGTSAADTYYGRGGNDHLEGAGDNDDLYGEDGNDTLFGNTGADRLFGGANPDRLYGGPGRDVIDGGSGDDRLYADDDTDSSTSGSGDTVRGDLGNDTIFTRDGEVDVVQCGDGTRDVVIADNVDEVAGDCERVARAAERSGEADALAERATEWAKAFIGLDEKQLYNLGYWQVWTERTGNASGTPGSPEWCGIFAHEAYFQAGRDLPNEMDYTNWLYSTTSPAFSTVASEGNIKRGDLLLFDWNGDNDPDHIGIAAKDYVEGDGGKVQVVSGNSSMPDGGPNGVDLDTNTFGEIIKVRRVN